MNDSTKDELVALGVLGALALIVVSPLISVAASLLDAWALLLVLGWYAPAFMLTYWQAFGLSLAVALLAKQSIPNGDNETGAQAFTRGLVYAFLTPPMIVVVAWIGHFMVGR